MDSFLHALPGWDEGGQALAGEGPGGAGVNVRVVPLVGWPLESSVCVPGQRVCQVSSHPSATLLALP